MIFTPVKRIGGGPITPKPYYIASAEAIVKGMPVTYGVAGIADYDATDADDPIRGIAAEDHDGSTAGRQSGYEILIYDDPDIIFACIPHTLSTTTGGDATSWIDSSLTAANDVFNGGKIVIVSTNSIAGFNVGDVLDITDFANSGGDATVTGAGGTIAAGMTGYIYPGYGAINCHAFDAIATTFNNLDMDTAGGETFNIDDVIWDAAKKKAMVLFTIRLHERGNDGATIS
jgi:hypothetical protein